jgi:hypothetical protein
MLKQLINWLVETHYPDGAFYGGRFFDAFKKYQKEDGNLAQASTLWITHNMHRLDKDTLEVKIKGLTINGEPVGDFFITAERTKPPSPPRP